MTPMTAKKMAAIIRANFTPDERIMLHAESTKTNEEGWAFDTAWGVIKNLSDPEVHGDPDEEYYFTVGRCIVYDGEMI